MCAENSDLEKVLIGVDAKPFHRTCILRAFRMAQQSGKFITHFTDL
jgi:hypothetical protein